MSEMCEAADQGSRGFTCLEEEAHISLGRTWAVLDHAFSEALKPFGVTPTQYNVLRILRDANESGLCRGEVMERMIAKVPDATRLLDRMEASGLIARERGTTDRRFVTTRLTESGRALLTELDEPVRRVHREHFGSLDEARLQALIAVLAQVRSAE